MRSVPQLARRSACGCASSGQSPTFLLLLGAFSLCGFTTAGVIETHLLPYAAACGYPILESATAYGVLGAFNGLGLLVFGYLADRYNPVSLLAGMFFARAATFVLLLYIASDVSLLFLFAALFGMINFATLPVVTTIVAGRLGIGVIGLAMGILFGGHSAGAAAGAFMADGSMACPPAMRGSGTSRSGSRCWRAHSRS